MTIHIPSTEALPQAASQFLASLPAQTRVVALYGAMGAGKTTFVRALCQTLGVTDVVTSPTFAIVNEYTDASGQPLYHFDFYRIRRIEEVYDMGYEDYFYSGHLCLIEWPELIEEILPPEALRVTLRVEDDGSRTMEL